VSEHRFPIMGDRTKIMLGRAGLMERIWNGLTKPTPSNLSIIGPRYIGKSVIVNALVQRLDKERSPYRFVLCWPLGRVAPQSDHEFIAELCDRLIETLSRLPAETADFRAHLTGHSYQNLKEVADFLDEEGMSLLMVWDGLDKPLGQGNLSRQLWDELRSLFYGRKHRIITVSRRPLSELLSSQEAISSPFWNIFDMNPVRVGPFDDRDRDLIIGLLSDYHFEPGAKTELFNWSGGLPPLFLEILNQVIDDIPPGSVTNEDVNRAALKALDLLRGVISDIWQDCPAEARDLYTSLMERRDFNCSGAGRQEMNCLIEMGFARQAGNKLMASCRMLDHYIRDQKEDASSMGRLFGSWEAYRLNIRSLLEKRLAHITRFDDRLFHLVEQVINDIPDYPDDCLNNLNNIRDCALKLIWQREFGPAMCTPQAIVSYWAEPPRNGHKLIETMVQSNCWNVPTDPLDQIRLLGLLTGSHRQFDNRAKTASKDSYVLIDAIHNFRNRGQHPDGQAIHLGVAVAAIMACLELLACLERELG
jgi:hypothetical protein